MSTLDPGAAPDAPVNQLHLSKDARVFGITVANAVRAELEGKADDERLQAMQDLFMQAVDHIEKRYGLMIGTKWMEDANQAIQQRFAELNDERSPYSNS